MPTSICFILLSGHFYCIIIYTLIQYTILHYNITILLFLEVELLQNKFESHLLSVKPLPFIFHFNTVKRSNGFLGNWHNNTEFLYITNGSGLFKCGEEIFEAAKGDIIIANSNIYHSIASNQEVKYYCLIPDSSFCKYNGIDTENLKFINKITDNYVNKLFDAVIKEFNHNTTPYREAAIKASVLSLLVYLAANYTDSLIGNKFTSETDQCIKHTIAYIRSHIGNKLTIDELANYSGLSKYYFMREFKKMTGDSPIIFINKMRCENAKKMLKSGAYSVKETAEKCAFESVSYFCKAFKKYTGYTPTKFTETE